MSTIWGYCRISRKQQSIERQERNILAEYPTAVIKKEIFTGAKMNRPEWQNIFKAARAGDTIVFDSISRMSRNAEDGIKTYFELLKKGVHLVFLKEHYIDTEIYENSTQDRIGLTGTDEDKIVKGINNYFRILAEKQIRIAFEQAQKEIDENYRRIKDGIETARLNGKQIGQPKGSKLTTRKSIAAKEIIKKHSKDFEGSLKDKEVIKLAGISRNSFYKYKREVKAEI